MFKFAKWTLIGALCLGAAGYFFFGRDVVSYVSTMATSVKDSVRGEIPIEFELKRAETLIQNIAPQIDQCKLDVARAEVRLEALVGDIERLERDVARAEQKLKTGADRLAGWNGEAQFELAGGQNVSRERLEIDLERTFETFKTNQGMLRSKRALVERETAAVAAARNKLDAVRAEEARLKDLIGQLKTQKAQVEAMRASSKNFSLDDSALGEAKQVLATVKERLDVAQRMLEDDLFFEGHPTPRQPSRDIVKEIRQHFSAPADEGLVETNPSATRVR